jgi:hypothetical protein
MVIMDCRFIIGTQRFYAQEMLKQGMEHSENSGMPDIQMTL